MSVERLVMEYPSPGTQRRSICDIVIHRDKDGGATVLVCERPDNPGASVTNAAETIATRVATVYLADVRPELIRFVEHYPREGRIPETFDRVRFTIMNEESSRGAAPIAFENPAWERITDSEECAALKDLLEHSSSPGLNL